ncbi:MAG: leucine-rich repeat domain-containing protein [Clostridia bacterium]|nr:leucine-rich repeat domain-containing protein [Clostridia bacterium]
MLTSLELLDAADTHVHSLDPLAGLKRLRYLYLEADMFADDEPIIESFALLAGLELLEELSANVGDVPKLECLVGNKALQVQYFRTLFRSGWMSVDEILRLYQLSAE